jgi:hypothetical protein
MYKDFIIRRNALRFIVISSYRRIHHRIFILCIYLQAINVIFSSTGNIL